MAKGMAKELKGPQRFACAICGSRKPPEDFPLDKDHNVRVAITCSVCLEPTSMADQSGTGLLEKLQVNVDSLENSIAANMLKRKYDDNPVLTNRQKKKTKLNSPKPAVPLPAIATCSICCEEKPASEFPTRPPSGKKALSKYSDVPTTCAKHLHIACDTPVCKQCITAYLTASLDLKGPDKLGCPASGCKAIWGLKFIRAYMTVHAFANYCQLLFQRYITRQHVVWCHDPHCGEGGIIESRTGIKTIPPGYPNLECAACKKRQCVLCKVEWHKDMTCQEYREERGEDQDLEEQRVLQMMMNKGARRCRHCQLAVEKDGGCDYMLCPHCQQQFYWATAEPVRANTKGTRQAAKSEEHKHSQPDPLFRPCEADAAATHAAALVAAQNQPVHQADWDINVAGFPIANFFDW